MKKFALTTLLLGALTGGFASSAVADDCCFNPCAPTCCEWSFCDGKFRLGADYLYWKTEADDLQFGSTTTLGTTSVSVPSAVIGSGSGSSSDVFSGSSSGSAATTATTVPASFTDVIHPDFKYDSGFRVWVGYELPGDLWEMSVAYTYLPSRATTGLFSVTPPVITGNSVNLGDTATLVVPGINSFVSTEGRWTTTFQYIDVDLARTVRFGECFRLRPHMGFRAAWGDQQQHNIFTFAPSPIIGGGTNLFTHAKETFQGYGVEGGLWADYHLGYGVSVVGHVGGSVLYTKIKTHSRSFLFSAGLPAPGITLTTLGHDTIHTAIPTTDYFVGLQYADNFCDFDFNVHIGWEQHVFFDLSRLGGSGNYSTQGLTAGLEIGF